MAERRTTPPNPRGAEREQVPPPGGAAVHRADPSTAKHMAAFSAGLGAWLILAPFLLGYDTAGALWNDVVCGIIVLGLGILRYTKPLENVGASYTNAGVGFWLLFAPFFLLPYEVAAYWNDIVVGALLIITGLGSALAARRAAAIR
ncbi:SPW repeat [Jannaschia seosinensis]|uniref:SPW repeat n=1 Tax=Jannaschia seosinensis TaxID=313367 RepID=A0A0M7BFK8_9RHOB|nr:SPW repeat protein [Jannaschia seosinensis]CUH40572.1 SPW repeat [Jannaschia seosinensis]